MMFLEILFPTLFSIPDELSLRDFSTSTIVGYGLFVSFVFVALSKLLKSDMFKMLFLSNYKIKTINIFLKDNFHLNRPESFLLIFNYFISSGIILFILFDFPTVEPSLEIFLVILFPIFFFLFSILTILFSSLLLGERIRIQQLLFFRIIGSQYLGVLFSILALLWMLTNVSHESFLIVVVVVTLGEFLVRIFKGTISVLQKNVPWYYIILYFCTLEILPIIIFYYYLESILS